MTSDHFQVDAVSACVKRLILGVPASLLLSDKRQGYYIQKKEDSGSQLGFKSNDKVMIAPAVATLVVIS